MYFTPKLLMICVNILQERLRQLKQNVLGNKIKKSKLLVFWVHNCKIICKY